MVLLYVHIYLVTKYRLMNLYLPLVDKERALSGRFMIQRTFHSINQKPKTKNNQKKRKI